MTQEINMKHIITLSVLSFITTINFVSKSNVRGSVSNKVIYKDISLQANSFQKEGEGFFDIPLPLTPYDATTY